MAYALKLAARYLLFSMFLQAFALVSLVTSWLEPSIAKLVM